MVLFGLTWVFAAFTVNDASIAFQFLFAIFNSLQGFFIFLFYCVVSRDARMLWVSVICRPFGIAQHLTDTSTADSRAQRLRQATRSGARGTVSTGFSTATRSRAVSLPTDSSVSEIPSFVEVNPTAEDLGVIQEEPSGVPSSRDSELLAGTNDLDTAQQSSSPAETASAHQPPRDDTFEPLRAPRLSPIDTATVSHAEEAGGSHDLGISVQRHSTSSHHYETAAISFGGSEDEEDEIHTNLAASMTDLPSESN